jgi:copper chaperone CopZ
VKPELAGRVGEGPYSFCPSPACEVVYFNEADPRQRFLRPDVRVRVGAKETEPPATVCYCFDWTVGDIECELRLTNATTIPDRVKEKSRQGFCRCETMNPLGVCCLGEVNRAAREARTRLAVPAPAARGPQQGQGSDRTPSPLKGARTATLGAVLTAALGSACCWLPLLLIALGFSAAGVGSFFEQYRLPFLCATFALLAVAWYLTYRPWGRRGHLVGEMRAAEPPSTGSDCCAPHPAPIGGQPSRRFTRRLNEVMLWAATLLVLLFALFPSWSGLVFGDGGGPGPADGPGLVLEIHGMTCDGCAATVRKALRRVPGVARVAVDYPRALAVVTAEPGSVVRSEALLRALEEAGFHARVRKE